LSVRVRITATVALLVALALGGAGLIVYAIQSVRVADQSASEVDQELAELAKLSRNGQNPSTGQPYRDVGQMILLFLNRNVPDDDELLVGWWDDRAQKQSPANPLTQDPDFEAAVRPLVEDGGTTEMDTPDGPAQITVQPVSNGSETGALVVVTFLDETRSDLYTTMRTYTIVSLLALFTITALAWSQAGRLLRPLRTLRETAEEISATDLARRLPETGNDDITALTRTFNGMLARLEAAFVGQRQFLDDVGHELKTPLTVLRGHLELLDHEDPAEVAQTRALLLDEIDRMSRLVGDLILLAKSGRPDFLALQPVSLERLTHTLLAKARGLGDRAWKLDGAGEAIAAMDEQRITQAVLALADNAVKHTRAGDEIAIGSSYDVDRVRVWVRDTGAGVPDEDKDRIFERFGRSEVPAGDEGFGLGLSIVQAITEAHGGTVTVEDAEPGARFVLTLPVAPRPAEALDGEDEDTWPGS
jgi:signal transduction histidine kinase